MGDTVLDAIALGKHDDELTAIVEAVKDRVVETSTRVCWRIVLGDVDVTEQSLTLAEALSVERQTGMTWGKWHPTNSATQASAIIVAVLVERHGMKVDEAFKRLREFTAEEVVASISEYQPEPRRRDDVHESIAT